MTAITLVSILLFGVPSKRPKVEDEEKEERDQVGHVENRGLMKFQIKV